MLIIIPIKMKSGSMMLVQAEMLMWGCEDFELTAYWPEKRKRSFLLSGNVGYRRKIPENLYTINQADVIEIFLEAIRFKKESKRADDAYYLYRSCGVWR